MPELLSQPGLAPAAGQSTARLFPHRCGEKIQRAERQKAEENQPATLNLEILRNDPEAKITTLRMWGAAQTLCASARCGEQSEACASREALENQSIPVNGPVLRNDPEAKITIPQMQEAA